MKDMMRKEKFWKYFLNILIFTSLAGYLMCYISKSIGPMPLMDYWLGSGDYLESVMTEPLQLDNVISFPHALHWNPFFYFFDYFFVRYFYCDNRAYIYAGMVICFISIIILMKVYNQYFKVENKIVNAIGTIICTMPIINLNQWEIITLYCYFAFMARILIYLLLFYALDRLLHSDCKKFLSKAILYSVISIIVINGVSQAYFPGMIAAVIGAILINCLVKKERDKYIGCISIIVGQIVGSLLYYVTLDQTGMPVENVKSIIVILKDYFKGLLVMLGATVIPLSKQTENINFCYIVGGIILILAGMACFLFFKMKMYNITYFPLMCLIYAFVSIIVIIYGRLDRFGLESLGSSRYVVETTIGLIGLLQIYWKCLHNYATKIKYKVAVLPIIMGLFVAMIWANHIEMGIGPYRKDYNENMVKIAKNIDNVKDEDLTIFQAPAEDVRAGIAVMKKYHLCVWQE